MEDTTTAVMEPSASARASSEFDALMSKVQPEPKDDKPVVVATDSSTKTAPIVVKTEPEVPDFVTQGEPPPVKTEAKDEEVEAIPPPAKMSQSGTSSFAQLRSLAEKRGAELKRVQAELETAKKAPVSTEDPKHTELLTAAQQRAVELEAKLERASFRESAKYQRFEAAQAEAVNAAKEYLKGSEIDPSVVDQAAHATPSQRLKILRESGADEDTRSSIITCLNDYDKERRGAEAALGNHKSEMATWQAGESARSQANEARQRAEEDKSFSQVVESVRKSYAPLQKYEGHEKWNAQADEILVKAKQIFNAELPLDKLQEMAVAAASYEVMDTILKSTQTKLKEAQAEVAKLKSVQPGAGNTNGTHALSSANMNDHTPEAIAARFDQRLQQTG